MINKVVILGASGFIAKSLKAFLERQMIPCRTISSEEVDLVSDNSTQAAAKIISVEDTLVVTSMLTPDKGKDAASQTKNILMGKHIAEILEIRPCAHVVYLSSDAVYPDSASLISERTPCDPGSLYGAAHLTRERMLMESARKKKIPLLILRPSAVYGPGDTHGSYGPNRFARSAVKENKITLIGNGEEKRDHIYIDDLVRLIFLLLEKKREGVLNLVSGCAVSFLEVAEILKKIKGKDLRIEMTPRMNPVSYRHFDNGDLLKAFPQFRLTGLEQGLSQTLKALSVTS